MEDNKKSFIEKLSIYITIISGLFSILGLSLYALFINSESIITFIHENIIIFLLIINIIFLLIYIFVISYNKIKKQDNPPRLSIFIIVFLLVSIILHSYLTFNYEIVLANNENNENADNVKTIEELEIESQEEPENDLTPEQRQVDYFVPQCKQRIFEVEFWSKFTDGELKYILNGIYAYEGMLFPGDYYEVFSWYNGCIKYEDFTEDMLCYNQHSNIANIIVILKQRGLR